MRVHKPLIAMEIGEGAALVSSDTKEILWRDAGTIYQPQSRALPDFLSSIEIIPPVAPDIGSSPSSLLVFVEKHCMEKMQSHAAGDTENEQAGILSGQACVDGHQHFLIVDAVFPAKTLASSVHFRFRDNAWDEIWAGLPEASVLLGWYHSHPGLGVFMSATDRKTQALHFRALWQIAVVLDPISGKLGIFHGAEAQRVPEESVFRYRKPGQLTPLKVAP